MSFYRGGGEYNTSLPMIANLVMSAPSLKRLTLDIRFRMSSLREFDWSPLNLVCSSSLESIKLHVTKTVVGNVFSEELLPCLEDNTDLMRMVKEGLLTIKTEKYHCNDIFI